MSANIVSTGAGTFVGEGLVDVDAVAAFAAATNDGNPRYRDGQATPLLFTTGLALSAYHAAHDAAATASGVEGYGLSVHGQHDVYYFGPVVPGTRCRWSVSSRSVLRTKGGVLLVESAQISDESGELLTEHLWSTFYQGGRVATEDGPPLPDHTFPDAARANLRASRTMPVDRDQGFRYGGATGDRAPHAIDDDQARREGFPGKILQGMCTFSMASAALVDLLAEGDPARVRRIAVRFSAPTRPRHDLTVNVFDVPSASDGGPAFAFEADQSGVQVLRHGRIELRP